MQRIYIGVIGLILANALVVLAFARDFSRHHSFVPIYIGILPVVLCNFIYALEIMAPKPLAVPKSDGPGVRAKDWVLRIAPAMFYLYLPSFDSIRDWSPAVGFGFSVLLCVVIVSIYGAVKIALSTSS